MKKFISLFLFIALALAVTACETKPQATPTPSTTPTEQHIVLKYGIFETEDHPQGICRLAFKNRIEELSDGEISIDINSNLSFFFSGDGEISALMEGDLEMTNVAFQDIASYLPYADMFASPYIFSSYEHMNKYFKSEEFQKFCDQVAKRCKYRPLAAMTQGARVISTVNTEPIITPEDLKGTLLRMPNTEQWLTIGKSLGADAIGIAYAETYTAIQSGLADACDSPLADNRAMKFYEVTKQISLTRHIIDIRLICVNNSVWNKMTEQQQAWMKEAAKYAAQKGSEAAYAIEDECLEFFCEQGLIITEPDIDAFREYSHQYYLDNGLTKTWDMDMYDAIQAMR